jgi:hypothetical protein
MHCGHRYGRGIHAPGQLFRAGQRLAAELSSHGLGPGGIGVHHRHQFHAKSLFLQFVINPGMVLAKRAYTNDCNPNWTFVSQPLIFSELEESSKGYHCVCRGNFMGRAFGFISLIIVVAVGAYIYMRQTQSVMTAGTSSPTATVDLVGIKRDLLAIAQAERSHSAIHGSYVSLAELRSQGELAMEHDNRGPYTYSAEVSDSSFRIVATYAGREGSGMPRTISIDQNMEISQQ